ncbi:unnamed protein product, partial [Closterium sp. NIES-53]
VGPHVHAWGQSHHMAFQLVTAQARQAVHKLRCAASPHPSAAPASTPPLQGLLEWLHSFRTLFQQPCSVHVFLLSLYAPSLLACTKQSLPPPALQALLLSPTVCLVLSVLTGVLPHPHFLSFPHRLPNLLIPRTHHSACHRIIALHHPSRHLLPPVIRPLPAPASAAPAAPASADTASGGAAASHASPAAAADAGADSGAVQRGDLLVERAGMGSEEPVGVVAWHLGCVIPCVLSLSQLGSLPDLSTIPSPQLPANPIIMPALTQPAHAPDMISSPCPFQIGPLGAGGGVEQSPHSSPSPSPAAAPASPGAASSPPACSSPTTSAAASAASPATPSGASAASAPSASSAASAACTTSAGAASSACPSGTVSAAWAASSAARPASSVSAAAEAAAAAAASTAAATKPSAYGSLSLCPSSSTTATAAPCSISGSVSPCPPLLSSLASPPIPSFPPSSASPRSSAPPPPSPARPLATVSASSRCICPSSAPSSSCCACLFNPSFHSFTYCVRLLDCATTIGPRLFPVPRHHLTRGRPLTLSWSTTAAVSRLPRPTRAAHRDLVPHHGLLLRRRHLRAAHGLAQPRVSVPRRVRLRPRQLPPPLPPLPGGSNRTVPNGVSARVHRAHAARRVRCANLRAVPPSRGCAGGEGSGGLESDARVNHHLRPHGGWSQHGGRAGSAGIVLRHGHGDGVLHPRATAAPGHPRIPVLPPPLVPPARSEARRRAHRRTRRLLAMSGAQSARRALGGEDGGVGDGERVVRHAVAPHGGTHGRRREAQRPRGRVQRADDARLAAILELRLPRSAQRRLALHPAGHGSARREEAVDLGVGGLEEEGDDVHLGDGDAAARQRHALLETLDQREQRGRQPHHRLLAVRALVVVALPPHGRGQNAGVGAHGGVGIHSDAHVLRWVHLMR